MKEKRVEASSTPTCGQLASLAASSSVGHLGLMSPMGLTSPMDLISAGMFPLSIRGELAFPLTCLFEMDWPLWLLAVPY